MRFLSLFSGIEAASVAWLPLGWECAAVAEIERFSCSVLKHHYPDVPNLGDVTKITEQQIKDLGHIDVVIFGFPCQDLSIAGKRQGLQNADGTLTRSGLFYHAERIARWANPRWTVAENVPGLFSSDDGRGFASVVGELAGTKVNVPGDGWRTAGVALGPRGLVEWCVLDAQYFRLAQRRKRVFLVRDYSGQWQHRPPLFLKPPGLWRNPPPSREAKERTSNRAANGAGASGLENGVIPLHRNSADAGVEHGEPDDPMFTLQSGVQYQVVQPIPIKDISNSSMKPKGDIGIGKPGESMFTMISGAQHGVLAPTLPARKGGGLGTDAELDGALIAHTLSTQCSKATEDGTGRGTSLVPALSHCLNAGGVNRKDFESEALIAATLDASYGKLQGCSGQDANHGHSHLIPVAMAVRRLTPTEFERLQGFPYDYTKLNDKTADGPRYRSLGNSMAVPVIRWIGERLQLADSL